MCEKAKKTEALVFYVKHGASAVTVRENTQDP